MTEVVIVAMPRLSDSMEEGTVVGWLHADGANVAPGDELVEIETDKATMTYEAEAGGILRRLVGEVETVRLGVAIAELLPARSHNGHDRIAASPVARRLAASRSIDLATVTPSGPRGRIVKRDVARALAPPAPPLTTPRLAPATAPVPATEPARGDTTHSELTRAQATVARRMGASRATVPDFSIEMDVDADALVGLRAELEQRIPGVPVPSFNDLVVKACALALRSHPHVNGAYRDGRIETYSRVNVGVAVAADGALLVPVVSDADTRSVGSIAAETRRMAEAARAGTLSARDLDGGTFTVSNLGMFGVTRFVAVVNPPQAAILAVGALEQRPVVRDGGVRPGHVMALTLCSDHRILYGADAAAFLADVRAALEEPLRLFL